MSNQNVLKGNWKSVAVAVKEKWEQISNDELTRVEGNYDQLVGLIQRKAGQSREQVEAFLSDCFERSGSAYDRVAYKAGQMVEDAGEYLQEGYDQVSESLGRGYESARGVVSRRPLESMAVVAGTALLGGLLLGLSLGCNRR